MTNKKVGGDSPKNIDVGFGDIFNNISRKKRDIHAKPKLKPGQIYCDNCGGSGARPGTEPKECSKCKGTGEITRAQRTKFGMALNLKVCSACEGRGKIIQKKCPKCNGTGRIPG